MYRREYIAVSLSHFVETLFDQGRVRVGSPGSVAPEDLAAAGKLLAELEVQRRSDFPGEPPEYLPEAGLWATEMLYRACQLAVCRDLGAENITAALAPSCPAKPSPATHYSVDLAWQFLPDLHRLTRQAAPDDPLVAAILRIAAQWPLSSVGIPDLTLESIDHIAAHRGLLTLYVDRILARGDTSRLSDPRVRAAVEAAIGLHSSLAPTIVSALALPLTPGVRS